MPKANTLFIYILFVSLPKKPLHDNKYTVNIFEEEKDKSGQKTRLYTDSSKNKRGTDASPYCSELNIRNI